MSIQSNLNQLLLLGAAGAHLYRQTPMGKVGLLEAQKKRILKTEIDAEEPIDYRRDEKGNLVELTPEEKARQWRAHDAIQELEDQQQELMPERYLDRQTRQEREADEAAIEASMKANKERTATQRLAEMEMMRRKEEQDAATRLAKRQEAEAEQKRQLDFRKKLLQGTPEEWRLNYGEKES